MLSLSCYRLIDYAIKINTARTFRSKLTDMPAEHAVVCVWYWRGHALKCIVLGINHQSRMLIPPWPCAECGGNDVCGAKDNTAAFVLQENNTADDAAALCHCCRPRSHVSLCQVTRPDKVAYCKDTDSLMYGSVFYCIRITVALNDFTITALA